VFHPGSFSGALGRPLDQLGELAEPFGLGACKLCEAAPALHYLYRALPLDELVPLYRTADVMLVTPIRDGMNLVAKEFVATRLDGDGVLVLSEFAGAADELTDAVLVNPHDPEAMREAIMTAVEMHRHERRDRMSKLRDTIRRFDVAGWAERFLNQLASVEDEPR